MRRTNLALADAPFRDRDAASLPPQSPPLPDLLNALAVLLYCLPVPVGHLNRDRGEASGIIVHPDDLDPEEEFVIDFDFLGLWHAL